MSTREYSVFAEISLRWCERALSGKMRTSKLKKRNYFPRNYNPQIRIPRQLPEMLEACNCPGRFVIPKSVSCDTVTNSKNNHNLSAYVSFCDFGVSRFFATITCLQYLRERCISGDCVRVLEFRDYDVSGNSRMFRMLFLLFFSGTTRVSIPTPTATMKNSQSNL